MNHIPMHWEHPLRPKLFLLHLAQFSAAFSASSFVGGEFGGPGVAATSFMVVMKALARSIVFASFNCLGGPAVWLGLWVEL